jgi:hypothetical protein
MNRRLFVLIALVCFVLIGLAAGVKFVSAQAPEQEAAPVALGQPGLSYRYVKTFGVTEQPYIADLVHLNRPHSLFIDSSNNLFVTEEQGQRLLKYNASGIGQFSIGNAGVCNTEDYGFCGISDAVTDGSGNIWVADGHRVAQYSATGTFLQQFPATDPWASGSDNGHFNQARGVALDSSGNLFVSDSNNHRIQVFNLTTGSPVYNATIGTAGVPGSGANQFNEPYRIAIDGSNRLIVADRQNNRVQRCTYSAGWTCATLDSGLNQPQGVATDSGNNVYIADTENGRIRKCTSGGACSDFAINTPWFYDVAVDSSGRVYGAAAYEDIVLRYSNAGALLGTFVGVEFVPYLTDGYHYNHPRVATDKSNNIILIEELGQRLIKLDSTGNFLWAKGVPGYDSSDNDHFSWPRGVATDQNNNIYVADGWNNRVQIFNSNGIYQSTLGSSTSGSGDYDFNWVSGIAVDNNGNIYVGDGYNHRVQIYNSSRVYVATIGVTGVSGSDNNHFNQPQSVEVDTTGNIYVLDSQNCRVQKFNSSRIYQMTFGTTGDCDGLTNLGHPEDVTMDAQGRVFISEWDNNAVKVYNASGAFLTSIGGTWGTNTSQFRGVSGVALDSLGNLLASDWENARIQIFSPGVPGWKQANINGFGDRNDQGAAMEVFNGQLYVGTDNWIDNFEINRTSDGQTWELVRSFGITGGVLDMNVFNGQLYASTGWGADNNAAKILRTSNGTTWDEVATAGFGITDNLNMDMLAIFQNKIYVSVSDSTSTSGGVSIYRSDTGNAGTWTAVVTNGKGDVNNHLISTMAEFNGYLYAGVYNIVAGTRIWRTSAGTTWTQVNTDGFGDVNNTETITLAVYKGQLYAGIMNNQVTGGEIWRTSNGITWSPVITDGFGDPNKSDMLGLYVFENRLYATTSNNTTGTEVWVTSDGDHWSQVNIDGWGDSNNGFSLRGNSIANFKNNLFISVFNIANGGEVWQMLHQVYLPLNRK